MKYLFLILLFFNVKIVSFSLTDNYKTIVLDKIILSVISVVHATVQFENDETRINEELYCKLYETVEYGIVSNKDNSNISLEWVASKNRITALAKVTDITHTEGNADNKDDYTFSTSYTEEGEKKSESKFSKGNLSIAITYVQERSVTSVQTEGKTDQTGMRPIVKKLLPSTVSDRNNLALFVTFLSAKLI
jgi:hypothetical protein